MNFITSRRGGSVDNAETNSVSSTHAIIEYGDNDTTSRRNRRPKKRERLLDDRLTSVVDHSASPRPYDVAGGHQRSTDSPRVTGPAGWAVTTSPRQENFDEEQDSEQGFVPLLTLIVTRYF